MNDIRFDTLKAARDLKAAGLEEAHAEAIVATMGRTMGENLATNTDIKELEQAIKAHELATKADFKELEQATRADIKAFEQATKADIKALEQAIKALEQTTKADNKALEQATDTKLTALEHRITVRLGGLTVAGVAFLATLIKLF